MPFGVLSYNHTRNIGDEIQSLAAWGQIPEPSYFLNRDDLFEQGNKVEGHVSVIMNGWYGQWPENWPPSEKIRPLFVSMHITREPVASKLGLRPADFMLAPTMIKYLNGHGPVGARDLATLRLLQDAGVDSYFSGCMTLTLKRPDVARTDDLVIVNDLPRNILSKVREMTNKPLLRTSHEHYTDLDQTERFLRARELLSLYARAHCVITTRLHCALPCLAMGTPVLLINTAPDQYRFAGLQELVHSCLDHQFLSGSFEYDVNNPPPNKPDYLKYREALIERVGKFVAEDATYSPAGSNGSYPTQGDKYDAILYSREKRAKPLTWRANRDTFLKKRVTHSAELAENEKINVKFGTVLTGKILGSKDGHGELEHPTLEGQAVEGAPWWACIGHFDEVQSV